MQNLKMDSITHLLRYCFDITMLETFICLYDRITRLEEFHEMFFGERPSVWSLEGEEAVKRVFNQTKL